MAVPVERSRVADQIFHDLREQIVGGQRLGGSKLPSEKELAQLYSVSGPTVREAIRGLALMGLVEVRHGSGAYVNSDGASLVAMSLGAIIQLRHVGPADALGLLGVLSEHAAGCAVKQATDDELRELRVQAEAMSGVTDIAKAKKDVQTFHRMVARAAHNPLLEVICAFLADVQIAFAEEVAGGSVEVWNRIFEALFEPRVELAIAIERREEADAMMLMRAFHRKANQVISGLPKARDARLSDPRLNDLLGTVVTGMRRHNGS